MNFFKTLFGVCSGTRCFPELLDVSPFKAFFHLLLLALLCTLAIGACRLPGLVSGSSRVCGELAKRLGDVQASKDGFMPSKAPKEHEAFILTSQSRLDYFPQNELSLAGMDDWSSSSGLIWTPTRLLLWFRSNGNAKPPLYAAVPLLMGKPPKDVNLSSLDKSKLEKAVKESEPAPLPEDVRGKFSIAELAAPFAVAVTGLLMLINFTTIFAFTSIVILFFASVQYMWVSGISPRLGFRNIVTISVYSAFPGVLAASLIPAFDLPLISFQTAFFVCFFIYHMMAFNAIQKFLAPPKQDKPSSWDDDDGF